MAGELCALYEVCKRGLNAAADKEGEAIAQFDMVLRAAMKPFGKKELDE